MTLDEFKKRIEDMMQIDKYRALQLMKQMAKDKDPLLQDALKGIYARYFVDLIASKEIFSIEAYNTDILSTLVFSDKQLVDKLGKENLLKLMLGGNVWARELYRLTEDK